MKVTIGVCAAAAGILLLLLLGWVGHAQTGPGECPTPSVQPNFDLARYLGPWYEIARLPFDEENNGVCTRATYTLESDGHVRVNNTERVGSPSGPSRDAVGDAVADPANPAKLEVTFSWFSPRGPYWILETDYDSYALVLSCTPILDVYRFEYAWLLSRTPTLPPALQKQYMGALSASTGVSLDQFHFTNQTGCW